MARFTVDGRRYTKESGKRPQGESKNMAKRESIGERLKTARLDQAMSVPQLRAKILQDHQAEIGESTIRDIEKDKTPNPGLKTLEFIALGVGLDPLELMSLGLDDPPQLEQGYTESQFAQLGRIYKKVRKDKRPFADELMKMLIEKMERWR
jgi:transcriptional regulator with XRE-family HTH domain